MARPLKNSTWPSSTAQQRAAQSSEIGPACSADARAVPPRPQPGPGPDASPINAGRSSEINSHPCVLGDQKRAVAGPPETLIPFSLSASLSSLSHVEPASAAAATVAVGAGEEDSHWTKSGSPSSSSFLFPSIIAERRRSSGCPRRPEEMAAPSRVPSPVRAFTRE